MERSRGKSSFPITRRRGEKRNLRSFPGEEKKFVSAAQTKRQAINWATVVVGGGGGGLGCSGFGEASPPPAQMITNGPEIGGGERGVSGYTTELEEGTKRL